MDECEKSPISRKVDMKKRVFYSFHYEDDCARAAQVRNIGVVEGNRPASDNDWQTITRGGDRAIEKWIHDQLDGCCCTIVLIGEHTAQRKWVRYEIGESWKAGKGVFGIYIHRLKNLKGKQGVKGKNPFNHIKVPRVLGQSNLADIVEAYAPPHRDSKRVYEHISDSISDWIDEAISIRTGWGWRACDFVRTLLSEEADPDLD